MCVFIDDAEAARALMQQLRSDNQEQQSARDELRHSLEDIERRMTGAAYTNLA